MTSGAHAPSDDERSPPSRDLAFWVATVFGSGLLPKVPGTWGSLASLVLWAPLVMWQVPWWARLAIAALWFLVGVPATAKTSAALGKDDPKEVVVDELVGQGIALALAGPFVGNVVLGFVLFRVFDIAKPWPVSWADKRHDAFGVMFDDVLAGVYALGVLTAVEVWLWPALGVGA
jgi:phosphatidylglycerophosphatase A